MNNIKACFSKKTDNWRTPTDLYKAFMDKKYIDCFKYKSEQDQYKENYDQKKLFVNPPYSDMKNVVLWLEKQIKRNNIIYLLIPARTDTKYFHDLTKYKPKIYFIKGRLHFNNSEKNAPFPSIILKFNDKDIKREYKPTNIQEFIEKEIE